jgi:hypothetical protein
MFHPGYCFPQISGKSRESELGVEEVQGGMNKEVSGSESV